MTMNESKKKTYRQFSAELKAEVCNEAAKGLQTHKELAEKFNVPAGLIGKWLRASEREGTDAFRGRGNRAAAEAEIARLKKENHELRLEKEILKKAAAYFAKNQS